MSASFLQQEWWVEHRTSIALCITIVGGFLCFTVMYYDSHVEDTTLGETIRNGPMFRYLVVGILALALPVFMNLIVDFYLDFYVDTTGKTSKSKSTNTKDILTKPEKLVFMLGIVIFPIVSCFTEWDKAILLATCCSGVQQQFVAGVVATSLNRFNPHFFPSFIMLIGFLLFTAGTITRSHGINTCASMPVAECNKLSIWLFQTYSTWIPAFLILVLISFWFSSLLVSRVYGAKVRDQYYLWPTSWSFLRKTEPMATTGTMPYTPRVVENGKSLGHIDDGLCFFRIVYCLTIVAWIVIQAVARINAILPHGALPYSSYNDVYLVLQSVPYIIFQVFQLFFEMRLVKHEAVSNLLALIDAKKTYVRYISHELRTPLSAASSGIQVLHAGKITSTYLSF